VVDSEEQNYIIYYQMFKQPLFNLNCVLIFYLALAASIDI
jgi:hypothetical protein